MQQAFFGSRGSSERQKFVWGRTGGKCVRGRTSLRALLLAVCLAGSAGLAFAQTYSVSWDRNPDAFTRGYRLFGGSEPGVYVWSVDVGNATTATLPPLSPGSSYYFTVRAYNAAGEYGPPSNEASIDLGTPGPPTAVTATTLGSRVTLTWGRPVSGAAAAQYLVSVGTSAGASNIVSAAPVGNQLSASGDLGPGRYFARVQAANGVGVGPASQEISFVVGGPDQPGSPAGLSVSWQGSIATLRWTAGAGAAAHVIEAGSVPGASNIATINVGAATQYSVDVPAGTYYVRVRAANGAGVSGPSNEIVVARTASVPGPPTALGALSTTSAVTLQWRAPTSGPVPTGYLLEVGSASGLADLAVVQLAPQTTYVAASPPRGTYYIRVRALNANGVGAPSNEAVVRR